MNKVVFVRDLSIGQTISDELFVVRYLNISKDKNGGQYCRLVLADKTGEIEAKIWSDVLPLCTLGAEGEVVKVQGVVSEYQGKLQLTLGSAVKVTDFDAADFVPVSEKNLDELLVSIEGFVGKVGNADLARMLKELFANSAFVQKFKYAPGAMRIHHGYLGGLMEHVLEMLEVSDVLVRQYPALDRDLLYAGIILHDLGKMSELEVGTDIRKTLDGRLQDHLVLGYREALKLTDALPEELRSRLLHIILAHHGHLEFGSPVVPKTPEAVAVYYLDNVSAKMNEVGKIVTETLSLGEEFSAFDKHFGTEFYISRNSEQNIVKGQDSLPL